MMFRVSKERCARARWAHTHAPSSAMVQFQRKPRIHKAPRFAFPRQIATSGPSLPLCTHATRFRPCTDCHESTRSVATAPTSNPLFSRHTTTLTQPSILTTSARHTRARVAGLCLLLPVCLRVASACLPRCSLAERDLHIDGGALWVGAFVFLVSSFFAFDRILGLDRFFADAIK